MTDRRREYEFVLNRWALGEDGAAMNVAEIKKARGAAAEQILGILQELEKKTGMVAESVNLDNDYDDDVNNLGVITIGIKLDLE